MDKYELIKGICLLLDLDDYERNWNRLAAGLRRMNKESLTILYQSLSTNFHVLNSQREALDDNPPTETIEDLMKPLADMNTSP